MKEGLQKPALEWLKRQNLQGKDKFCILLMDEMSLRSCFEYSKAKDQCMEPKGKVQVAMIKNFTGTLQQVAYYGFNKKLSPQLLKEITAAVEETGVRLVLFISDMESSNVSTYTKMGVTVEHPYWTTPMGYPQFVMVDNPHAIKLARNHFLDGGYLTESKVIANQLPVEKLFELEGKSDLKLAPRLPINALTVCGTKRQNVATAAKLMSNSTSAAIVHLLNCNYANMPSNTQETADLLKMFNDYFDFFNVGLYMHDSRPQKQAYGVAHEQQLATLRGMAENIFALRTPPTKKALQPFQVGMLMNIACVEQLFQYLKKEADFKYLLTRRMNQDDLERFFGAIRLMGGLHGHPSAVEFEYRLRAQMLGKS